MHVFHSAIDSSSSQTLSLSFGSNWLKPNQKFTRPSSVAVSDLLAGGMQRHHSGGYIVGMPSLFQILFKYMVDGIP